MSNQRGIFQHSRRRHIGVAVGLLIASAAALTAYAKGGPLRGTTGAYDVIAKGSYVGDGHAAVGAQSVTVNLKLTNPDTGVSGTLIAPNLDLNDGRFTGDGRFNGGAVTISGRIDPPDGKVVIQARITGTYTTADGLHGRFVGVHKGGGGG